MKEWVIFFLCSNDQAQYLPYVHFVKTHMNFFTLLMILTVWKARDTHESINGLAHCIVSVARW